MSAYSNGLLSFILFNWLPFTASVEVFEISAGATFDNLVGFPISFGFAVGLTILVFKVLGSTALVGFPLASFVITGLPFTSTG